MSAYIHPLFTMARRYRAGSMGGLEEMEWRVEMLCRKIYYTRLAWLCLMAYPERLIANETGGAL